MSDSYDPNSNDDRREVARAFAKVVAPEVNVAVSKEVSSLVSSNAPEVTVTRAVSRLWKNSGK